VTTSYRSCICVWSDN